MESSERARLFREAFARGILVFDGAMGTMIQARDLSADDFGGPQLRGLQREPEPHAPGRHPRHPRRPTSTRAPTCISTNTFGCAPYVLAEYGLADGCHEITLAAARLAARPRTAARTAGAAALRARRHGARHPDHHASPAASPSTRCSTPTTVQARALIEGGVDALLLETCQDTLNVKAAAIGRRRAMAEAGVDACRSWSAAPSSPWARCWPGRGWTRSTPRSSTSISSRSASTAPRAPSS